MAEKKKNDQYIKFWADTENFEYIKNLPKGTRGTAINEALKLYADTKNMASPVINTMRSAFFDSGSTVSHVTTLGSFSLSPDNAITASTMPVVPSPSIATSNSPLPTNRLVCPAGHLWLNGTERCVNSKCEYGSTQNTAPEVQPTKSG